MDFSNFFNPAGFGNSLLSFGGDLFSANRAFNKSGDKAAEIFQWQLEADEKKYRRAVKDLRAAGINPMLAVSGGLKGTGPSGVAAPSMTAVKSDMSANANSAMAAKRLNAEIDLLKAQAYNARSQGTNALKTADIKTPLSTIFGGIGKNSAFQDAFDNEKSWMTNLPKFGKALKSKFKKWRNKK